MRTAGSPLTFSSSHSFLDRGRRLPVMDPFLDRVPLIVPLLAFPERDLDLHEPVLEIHPCRHDREPLAGGHPHVFVDLPPVEEQLPHPRRIGFLIPLNAGIR